MEEETVWRCGADTPQPLLLRKGLSKDWWWGLAAELRMGIEVPIRYPQPAASGSDGPCLWMWLRRELKYSWSVLEEAFCLELPADSTLGVCNTAVASGVCREEAGLVWLCKLRIVDTHTDRRHQLEGIIQRLEAYPRANAVVTVTLQSSVVEPHVAAVSSSASEVAWLAKVSHRIIVACFQ